AVARRHDDDVIPRLRKSRGESRIATAARIVVLGGCGLESGPEEKEVRVERIGREVDRHGLAGVAREPPLLCVGILGTEQDVAAAAARSATTAKPSARACPTCMAPRPVSTRSPRPPSASAGDRSLTRSPTQ